MKYFIEINSQTYLFLFLLITLILPMLFNAVLIQYYVYLL